MVLFCLTFVFCLIILTKILSIGASLSFLIFLPLAISVLMSLASELLKISFFEMHMLFIWFCYLGSIFRSCICFTTLFIFSLVVSSLPCLCFLDLVTWFIVE